jgi:hypothetical protein
MNGIPRQNVLQMLSDTDAPEILKEGSSAPQMFTLFSSACRKWDLRRTRSKAQSTSSGVSSGARVEEQHVQLHQKPIKQEQHLLSSNTKICTKTIQRFLGNHGAFSLLT